MPVHRALPEGSHRHARRHAASYAGRTPAVPARAGRTPGGRDRVDPGAGQARRRARSRDLGRRLQGTAGGHLSAVQTEAADEGADRARGRPGAAGRHAARRSVGRPGDSRGRVRRRGSWRRGCRGRAGRCTRDPRRTVRGERRPDRRAARDHVVARPARVAGAGRQAGRRCEVRRLLRLRRAVREAAVAPDSGDVPRREGGGARPHVRSGAGRRRAATAVAGRPVALRAADRGDLRHLGRRPSRRQMARRYRALGLAYPDSRVSRRRSARPAVPGGRGRGGAGVRGQPPRSVARGAGRHPRDDGSGPRIPYRRQGRRGRRDRQGRRDRHDLSARAAATLGRVDREACRPVRAAPRRTHRDRQRHRVAGDRQARGRPAQALSRR